VAEVGIEAASFDGELGESGADGEGGVDVVIGGEDGTGARDEIAEGQVVEGVEPAEDESWIGWGLRAGFSDGAECGEGEPGGGASETRGDGGLDLLKNLRERDGAGDELKDAAALLFEGGAGALADELVLALTGEGGGFDVKAVVEEAGPESGDENGYAEEGGEEEEVRDGPPGRRFEESDVGVGAKADVEPEAVVPGVGAFNEADAGDADAAAEGDV